MKPRKADVLAAWRGVGGEVDKTEALGCGGDGDALSSNSWRCSHPVRIEALLRCTLRMGDPWL